MKPYWLIDTSFEHNDHYPSITKDLPDSHGKDKKTHIEFTLDEISADLEYILPKNSDNHQILLRLYDNEKPHKSCLTYDRGIRSFTVTCLNSDCKPISSREYNKLSDDVYNLTSIIQHQMMMFKALSNYGSPTFRLTATRMKSSDIPLRQCIFIGRAVKRVPTPISNNHCLHIISKLAKREGDGILVSLVSADQTRLIEPCRLIECKHVECFELESMQKLNECTKHPRCPICQVRASSWNDIYECAWTTHVLASTDPDVTSVVVEGSGHWFASKRTDVLERAKEESSIIANRIEEKSIKAYKTKRQQGLRWEKPETTEYVPF